MDIFQELNPLNFRIHQNLLESVVPELPDSLKDPILYFLETPGKKIRPLLTLLCCQAVGGPVDDAIHGATAVELFHDFTLIHDDIMDQDDMRRGRPTIHVKWDNETAILVGDTIIGLAYQTLLKSPRRYLIPVVEIFSEAIVKVSEGQALDKEFEKRADVSLPEYLEMIGKKTAWLIKISCELGAILGGGSPSRVKALADFGYNIGIGFQIQDDLLDVVADEMKLGKKVGSDFRMDKKTYLTLIYRETVQEHPQYQKQLPVSVMGFDSFQEFRDAFQDLGLVEKVKQNARQYIERGLASLNDVLPLDGNNQLYRLTTFLLDRQY